MSTITSTPRSGFVPATAPFGPHPSRTTQMAQDPEMKAQAEERAAQERISDTRRHVDEAENEMGVELDHRREEYENRSVGESIDQEAALEKQKTQGYAALRDLKRNQQKELTRVDREGSAEAEKLKDYYTRTTYQTEHQGKLKVNDIQAQQFRETEAVRKAGKNEFEETRYQNDESLQRLREDSEAKYNALAEASHDGYEKTRATATLAQEQADTHFQDRFQNQIKQEEGIIGNLHNTAAVKIREIRQDTSQKLSAYNARQKDPFYKLLDFDMSMKDTGEHYVLTANIPEYEQKHISVALKGNNLVVSGYRRNEEKLELTPGHSKGTAAYQSFHESFPLAFPVEGKKLIREFNGNQLVVTVPKKQEYQIYQASNAPADPSKPERVRVEKPKFPENLPKSEAEINTGLDGGEVKGTDNKKTKGSGTLT